MLSSLVGDRVVQEFAIRTLSSASSRLLLANENVNDVQLARVALSLLPQPKTTWKEDDSDKALVSFLSLLLIQNKDLKRELQECTRRCANIHFLPSSIDSLDMLSDNNIDSDVLVRIMSMSRTSPSLLKFLIRAVSSEKSNLTKLVRRYFLWSYFILTHYYVFQLTYSHPQ